MSNIIDVKYNIVFLNDRTSLNVTSVIQFQSLLPGLWIFIVDGLAHSKTSTPYDHNGFNTAL